jgi:hypothetical protein
MGVSSLHEPLRAPRLPAVRGLGDRRVRVGCQQPAYPGPARGAAAAAASPRGVARRGHPRGVAIRWDRHACRGACERHAGARHPRGRGLGRAQPLPSTALRPAPALVAHHRRRGSALCGRARRQRLRVRAQQQRLRREPHALLARGLSRSGLRGGGLVPRGGQLQLQPSGLRHEHRPLHPGGLAHQHRAGLWLRGVQRRRDVGVQLLAAPATCRARSPRTCGPPASSASGDASSVEQVFRG